MDSPVVSVILPVYNDCDVLPTAIESVLAQTLEELELIIVDDGSDDNTPSIVESYTDPRITFLQHTTNSGSATARNTGVKDANGDYIAFLDADDRWRPNKLDKQISSLESRSQEWVGIYCDFTHNTTPRNRIERAISNRLFHRRNIPHEGGDELIKYVLTKKFDIGSSSTLLVRKNAVEQIGGFDSELQRHVDLDFIIRLLQIGKIAYIDQELVTVAPHSNPSMDVIIDTKNRYLDKHSEIINELEANGYDIRKRHMVEIPRRYFEYGQLLNGLNHLSLSYFTKPSHVLRIVWSFSVGVLQIIQKKGTALLRT